MVQNEPIARIDVHNGQRGRRSMRMRKLPIIAMPITIAEVLTNFGRDGNLGRLRLRSRRSAGSCGLGCIALVPTGLGDHSAGDGISVADLFLSHFRLTSDV